MSATDGFVRVVSDILGVALGRRPCLWRFVRPVAALSPGPAPTKHRRQNRPPKATVDMWFVNCVVLKNYHYNTVDTFCKSLISNGLDK